MKKYITLCLIVLFCYSCSIPHSEPPTDESIIPTTLRITNTITTISKSTNTITNPAIPTITLTKTEQENLYHKLAPGKYIVYETRDDKEYPNYPLYVVSETGIQQGKILLGEQYYAVISPDNKKIAYSTMEEVKIYNLEDNTTITLPDRLNCFNGTSQLAWGPDNETLAYECRGIAIVKIPSGDVIGLISNQIYTDIDQRYFNIAWSPDGKWMAYYLHFISQLEGNKGPFITEVSCITNEESCSGKSRELPYDNDHPITWTPSSNLAVLDTGDRQIRIYNPKSGSIIKRVLFPDSGYSSDSIAWSPDEEWIAIRGGLGPGLYIFSIETGQYKTLMEKPYFPKFWLVKPNP